MAYSVNLVMGIFRAPRSRWLHAHLFILVGPRGSQVHCGMRQWPAMRSRRHRVTSVEPAPTRAAPDELVSVICCLTAALVGHDRLLGRQGRRYRVADDGTCRLPAKLQY